MLAAQSDEALLCAVGVAARCICSELRTPRKTIVPYSDLARYPENSLLALEIARQPQLWLDTRQRVSDFLTNGSLPGGPVVLTGAGTSANGGQAVAAAWAGARCIPTTDLLVMSAEEMSMAVPGFADGGVLVSLARSGDSPESAGAVEKVQRLFPHVQHIAISCNPDGKLARMQGVRVLLLNPETNDRSLAMTSSFSNLTLAGLLLVNQTELGQHIPSICGRVTDSLERMYATAQEIASIDSPCAVVLTSSMHGLAIEASLKLLELTSGERLSIAEGFLSFRHGPAIMLRENTPVLCFTSTDEKKLAYEEDFVRDLHRRGLGRIALIGTEAVAGWPHDWHIPSVAPMLPDHLRTPFEIVFAQLFAYASSSQANVDPDNPSPNGEVTRVVKPFTVHA